MRGQDEIDTNRVQNQKTVVIAALCFCLFMFGPHHQSLSTVSLGPDPAFAQDSTTSDSTEDDTPSEDDISDFQSEFDKDGDGEVDEPEEDEEDDVGDQDEPDEADEADDGDDGDDGFGGDESDDQDRENQDDDDDDGEEVDEDDDVAHSGKNRDDIDGEASPEFRLSGYDRYKRDGTLRRLGAREELTPLIAREETILLEN